MWRYNKTENLYYSRDKSNKLYHSDTYLGETYNDGLYHWKYIKRERKNGRWVYYYRDDEYESLKDEHSKAKSKLAKYDKSQGYDKLREASPFGTTYNKSETKLLNKKNSDKKRHALEWKVGEANFKQQYYEQFKKNTIRKDVAKEVAKVLNSASKAQHKAISKGKKAINKLLKKIKKKK